MGGVVARERQRGSRTPCKHLHPRAGCRQGKELHLAGTDTQAALAVAGGRERGAVVSEQSKSRVLMNGMGRAQLVL